VCPGQPRARAFNTIIEAVRDGDCAEGQARSARRVRSEESQPVRLSMPISTLRALATTPNHNRRKSPRIAFHGFLKHVLRRPGNSGARHDYLLQKDDIGIRLADGHDNVDQVGMLVTRMYRQRGYLIPVSETDPRDSIRRVTLEACHRKQTVGTLTVNLGSNDGLHAEELYGEEIAAFRRKGARLCEFTRLALDADDRGKYALACLFHLGFIFAYRIHHASDLFIEVNPRHALFYRRKLGFNLVGEEKICPRVNAPAVLMHKPLAAIADALARFGGLKTPQNKSYYSQFLPPWEEEDLVRVIEGRLAATGRTRSGRVPGEPEHTTEGLARSA
jgi:hypothetical protein